MAVEIIAGADAPNSQLATIEDRAQSADDGDAGSNPAGRSAARRDAFFATLLTMASHDLRQPLQVIIAAVDTLAIRLVGSTERTQLARVERAAARLTETLDQLVDALRLYEGVADDYHRPVWLGRALEAVALEFTKPAEAKGIEFRVARTGACALSHPVLLSGMVRNLIRNAIDYTPAGGRVIVACRQRGAEVHIEVRDSGVGIRREELANVFTAFQRVDASRSDGLGLGLFIVKRAAGVLGHRVQVRSAVGRGSCFAIIANSAECQRDRGLGSAEQQA
jgi:two-component system phosphate regulon sensor histidine kinase PhoR